MAHRTRERISGREPVHVTTRVRRGLPSLRARRAFEVVLGVFRERCELEGFRLVHWSVQRDHLHLIVEADSRSWLTRGLRGLFGSLARRLNRLWRRRGSVVLRHHEHVLSTPREVRHAVRYVLTNSRHHGHTTAAGEDPHASSHWRDSARPSRPTARPFRWLLTTLKRTGDAVVWPLSSRFPRDTRRPLDRRRLAPPPADQPTKSALFKSTPFS